MNPIVFAMRRPVTTVLLVVALVGGGVLASNPMRADILRSLNTPRIHGSLDYIGMRAKQMKKYVVGKYESYFHKHNLEHKEEPRKVVVTSPRVMEVTVTQDYVCQIHSQRHIEIQALDTGYLKEIAVREGRAVKKDDVMFRIVPVLYKTKRDAELAEARLAELEYLNTKSLFGKQQVVSANEVKLFEAKKDRAKAKADQAQAELDFTEIRAPFDGIIDRLRGQLGSLFKEGDILTTLSDNSVMWVYFNVSEQQYLKYMANQQQHEEDKIELVLANHTKFPQPGKLGAIVGSFNSQTGDIPFRADFANPDRLLRHGQSGTIRIHGKVHDAIVISQRATYEMMDKRYVYVVDKDNVVHRREIVVQDETDDIFVITKGVGVGDRIVLEGIRQVRDGEKVEYEFRPPEEVMRNLKNHAE
jgi:membrane fusion protein (multidrug efflux system)